MKTATVAKHILLVEDEAFFREALQNVLKQAGYAVSAAADGRIAQEIFGLGTFDAVVSDINMPGANGIDLLKFIRSSRPDTPVILMTGFAELKETIEADALGARGFLAKPFKKEELLDLLKALLSPPVSTLKEETNQDLNYCRLGVDDFISGHQIKYDIYVRLSGEKFVKIAHQGEDIPKERINAYKAKNIRFLFMRKDDFRKYMGFNVSLMPLVIGESSIIKEKKRSFIKHTNEVILEHLHLNGVDSEGFQAAKTVLESTVQLLAESSQTMELLDLLNSHADHLYAHALGVSMYGVMIARRVKWHSPVNIYKVAMGGLLHDIGKKEISRDILLKPSKERTAGETQIYETHPNRGLQILMEVSSIPSDVLEIVMQHHENCLGQGFPMSLPKNRTHPMARLISVANEFCNLVLKGPDCLGLSPQDTILRMASLHEENFDPTFFIALKEVFHMSTGA